MKRTGVYLIGYIVFIGGVLVALWVKGFLFTSIGLTWTVIGVTILIGFGIVMAASHSGTKRKIGIDWK